MGRKQNKVLLRIIIAIQLLRRRNYAEITSMRKLLQLAFVLTAIMSCSSALAQTCSQSGNTHLYCVPIQAVEDLSIPGSKVVATVPPAFSGLNASLGIELSDVSQALTGIWYCLFLWTIRAHAGARTGANLH